MCAHLGLGLGENNNGKNILGFGVLGVEHGGMSGEEISFYSSLRGPAAQLGKEENSSLLPRVHSVDLLYQQGAWGTCRVSSTGSESALKQDGAFKFWRYYSLRKALFPTLPSSSALPTTQPSPPQLPAAVLCHPDFSAPDFPCHYGNQALPCPSGIPTSPSGITILKLEEPEEHQPRPMTTLQMSKWAWKEK